MIEIYKSDGSTLIRLEDVPEGSIYRLELMKEEYVQMSFSLPEQVSFHIGSYLVNEYGKFVVNSIQKPTYNTTTGGYDYTLRLDKYYFLWNNKKLKFIPSEGCMEASFSLTSKLGVHLEVIDRNLKAMGLNYSFVYESEGDEVQFLRYDSVGIIDAMTMIAQAFSIEWWITGTTIHFGKCENSKESTTFSYEQNMVSMSPQDSKIEHATRLYAFGSSRNIPKDYRLSKEGLLGSISEKRLMLPKETPFIGDTNLTNDEIIERIVVFDYIYPRYVGTVTGIETYDDTAVDEETGESVTQRFYRFSDDSLTFSDEYIIEGETLHVVFQSGHLSGLDFELAFNPKGVSEKNSDGSTNRESQWFEIIVNSTYGLDLPSDGLIPSVNDKFVLYGYDTSFIDDNLLPLAEQELYEEAVKEYNKSKEDPNTYTCVLDSDWVYRNNFRLGLGDPVTLVEEGYFPEGERTSRVIGWEIKLDLDYDEPIYIIGEKASYGRLRTLEDKINSSKSYGTIGGGSSINGRNLYISKQYDDTAQGKITFKRGLKSLGQSVFGTHKYEVIEVDEDGNPILDDEGNEVVKIIIYDGQRITEGGNIVTGDFNGGALGSGSFLGRYRDTHDTYLELDRLFVRKKAQFTELEIDELSHVGGEILLTLAAADCIAVEKWGTSSLNNELHVITDEELANSNLINPESGEIYEDAINPNLPTVSIEFFRCYMNLDDGEKEIENRFRMYDQVMCQEFNINSEGHYENISNKFYWRLVVGGGKGYDYIDLSNRIREDNVVGGNETRSLRGFVQGSDIPEAGDTMVQLGNRTNKDRRNAIIISTYGAHSPSISKYAGIMDFNTGEEFLVSFDGFEGDNQMLKQFGSFFFGDKGSDPVEYIRFTHSDRKEGRHGTLEICASSITLVSGDTKEDIIDTFDKLNGDVKKIKEQNDKEYTIWFGGYVPTLSNEPASNWSVDEYSEHVQDIMYDKEHGFAYRFENTGDDENPTYEWVEITDAETLRALELVKKKSTVHFQSSLEGVEPPYNVGDTWSNATYYARDEEGNVIYDPVLDEEGNPTFYPNGDPMTEPRIQYDNDFLVCVTAKGVGEAFDINDWRPTNWFSRAIFNQEKDKITQSVTNMVQLSKEDQKKYADELAEKTKNEAEKALKYALYGDEENDDVESSVFYNISVVKQTADAIVNAVGGLDKDGNLTEQTSLVLKSNFASIFTAAYNENGLPIKKADIDTFIKKDKNGNIESGIKLSADQIDFSGKKINLSADEVNVDADAININGEELPDYISNFYNGNEITAPISGGISGFLQVADGTALTWTNGILTSAR